ncbi:FCD domain-containing protein, partial [Idiomarina abyssalis]
IDALNSLSNSMTLLGGTTLQYTDRPETAYQEHKKMIDSIRSGNADQADADARHHIRSAQRLRMKLLRE